METIWVELVLIIVAILANGFFAGSEIALVSARTSRLAQMSATGDQGAAAALALKKEPETFLATIQIAITLVGTLASAVGGAAAVEALTPWLERLPVPWVVRWADPVALGIVIVAITFVSLVIGELTPKALALRDSERAASLVARPLAALTRLVAAPNRILTASTRLVLFLLGQRDAPPPPLVSEEEVKFMIREGVTHGVFERRETEMIERVLRFTDTPVRAIMVPRPRIVGLDLATPPDQVLVRAAQYAQSRYPVYRGSIDETVGVVTIKDILRCVAEGRPPVLDEILHAAIFVPETARTTDLLANFQRHSLNMAMIVDEYGRVVGLVTIEDMLEEIVGEIREERERTGLPGVTRLPDGTLVIDGATTVRDLHDRLGLPIPESADYQTLAGFMLHQLQSIPRPGVSVSAAGHLWTVVDMEGPRIAKVKAQPRETEPRAPTT
ncbi:MAG: hemolysin family protein [Candidatus Rokubacteria bacterium]|nr:hemolysin family protein [Candidatus Rokubacteria bacterium]